jgi:hypothetical protein
VWSLAFFFFFTQTERVLVPCSPLCSGPPPPAFFQGWFAQYYNMIQPHEWPEITGWFQSIDTDRSGSIAAHEIARCTFGGFPL